MASMMMSKNVNLQRQPFTSGSNRPARRSARSIVRASQDAKDQQSAKAPSEFMMKTIGALAAAQLAFLPAAGPALAAKGKLAVEGGLQAGEAAQQAVPKGAKDPKTREDRNDSRDAGLAAKLDVFKQRTDADTILNSPDIESGGRQNIFAPSTWGKTLQPPAPVALDATSASSLQVNVGFNPADKAGEAVDKAKDAAPSGNPLEALSDKIKGAAVTNDSPQRQLEQGANKTQEAIKSAPKTKNVSFDTWSMTSLMHTVDQGNASLAGPQGNEGGITQPTERTDLDLPGNPKRGGDLKDSPTDFAAQNKGGRDEGTPGQTGASARPGANTPKGTGEIRNPQTPVLPNALGGKGFVRDDSESPEATAAGNIAKAQQSNGNAIDSLKKGLGL
jgi:hypothetical protein